MSIWEIEKRIMEKAAAEAENMKAECEHSVEQLEKVHAEKKEEVKSEILEGAKRKAEVAERSHLVPARLAARKALLEEKQKVLSGIYKEIKKGKKLSPAEMGRIREQTEVKAAGILFGE
jgi:vacuolar-type H+-ATPase subunit E/Vma4